MEHCLLPSWNKKWIPGPLVKIDGGFLLPTSLEGSKLEKMVSTFTSKILIVKYEKPNILFTIGFSFLQRFSRREAKAY
jgi:hypothetical protein